MRQCAILRIVLDAAAEIEKRRFSRFLIAFWLSTAVASQPRLAIDSEDPSLNAAADGWIVNDHLCI